MIKKLVGTEDEERTNPEAPLLKRLRAIASSDTRSVDIDHLTDEQTAELNEYAAELYRQVRKAFGTYKDNQLVTTKETNKLAQRFAQLHVETTRKRVGDSATYGDSLNTGHLPQESTIRSTIPVEVGIAKNQSDVTKQNGYLYSENMSFAPSGFAAFRKYNATTMGGLKAHIYEAISQFLYRDAGANYGHTVNVVRGASKSNTNSQLSFAFAHTNNYTSILFDETEISDANATLTKRLVSKKNTTPATNEQLEALKREVETKTQELTQAEEVLKEKQAKLTQLTEELTVLKTGEDSIVNRFKELEREINELTTEKTTLEKIVREKDKSVQEKQAAINAANPKIAALTQEITALQQEHDTNVELFKKVAEAKKVLTMAQEELKNAQKVVAELQTKIDQTTTRVQELEKAIKENEQAIATLNDLKSKLVQEQTVLTKLEADLQNKQQDAREKHEGLKKATEKLNDLKVKLANLNRVDHIIDKPTQEVEKVVETEKTSKPSTWVKNDKGEWTYIVDDKGTKATGWIKDNGTWYHLNDSGTMQTGWIQDKGTWYYLNHSGSMQTGWVQDNGTWYYLNPTGSMQTGWVQANGTWYYLSRSGSMKTGWIQTNGTWYYLNGTGSMQTGWFEVNGKWYYADKSGALLTNTTTPDGYQVNEDGEWV